MATRYWVGGSGTWTASNTANWSASSGGPGGASAPTSVDDVVFDSASNATAYAVTIGADFVGTGYITGGQLVITAVTSGTLAVGQYISYLSIGAPITIVSLGSGTGGVGTYNLSAAPAVAAVSGETISAGGAVCQDLTAAGPASGAVTFNLGATTSIDIYGSLTLPATNLTWTAVTGALICFRATTTGKTVTTNGVSLTASRVDFDGIGGGWTLGSAVTLTNPFRVLSGTFDTANYNIDQRCLY